MKRVLVISPQFFEYGSLISNELQKSNYKVTSFYNSELINSRNPIKKKINNYQHVKEKNILYDIIKDNDYDFLLVIKGTMLDLQHIRLFKEKNKQAKLINFQWDSIDNINKEIQRRGISLESMLYFYDEIYTFDLNDYINDTVFNLKFRPDFYSIVDGIDEKNNMYDIGTVGSMTLSRFELINKIENFLPHLRYRILLRNGFGLRTPFRLIKYGYKFMQYSLFKQMSYKDAINEMASMKAVIDIPNEHQSGLTMRVFEALSVGSKLITTSQDIIKYDFFDPNNILILNESLSNIDEIEEFLSIPFVPMDPGIWEKYHVSGFVKAVIEGKDYNYLREDFRNIIPQKD